MFNIASLLSARLFINPQARGNRIYFLSNMSGHLSLYGMFEGGSVPEPLLPPNIALQNPHLIGGLPFSVFSEIGKILVMIDHDGDENYQPMLIPLGGGFPEPIFPASAGNYRLHLVDVDIHKNLAFLSGESNVDSTQTSFCLDVSTGEVRELAASPYGAYPMDVTDDLEKAMILDSYTTGDTCLYMKTGGQKDLTLLYGTPLELRQPGQPVPLNGIMCGYFVQDANAALLVCSVFEDTYGLAVLDFNQPQQLTPVRVEGIRHEGVGELVQLSNVGDGWYALEYNIDGCSWLYEGVFDYEARVMRLENVLVGETKPLANGMLFSWDYDHHGDRYALSYSTATSPTQIFTVGGDDRQDWAQHTREAVLGVSEELLSAGEDASFVSYDGVRVSARLYLPAAGLGYSGKRPVVYYVHGGPQGQERPDFAWFSMPLIQFLTLNGFAVFVPNVRGSTGYGLAYTKMVDRDWGGDDRLDHVEAMKILSHDERLDASRAAVVGRSYGGYMTLTLASRHPELWTAAVDMFGPFDLLTFLERIPETWKPYFKLALGDPATDRAFLLDRSPRTHIDQIRCPLLVIQGKNDPRVVEKESRDLVDYLRAQGKQVEYLMFDNEGHDVLKYENRVRCYTAITEFFKQTLKP